MTKPSGQLEIVALRPEMEESLCDFFQDLACSGDAKHFHPHPLTAEAARERARYSGLDVYCVVTLEHAILAYGMLRGWDQGFTTPSLGICVRADSQSCGIGRLLLNYLHTEASRRGVSRVRLKVYPDNTRAIGLYQSLGYEFEQTLDNGQLIGFITLSAKST